MKPRCNSNNKAQKQTVESKTVIIIRLLLTGNRL